MVFKVLMPLKMERAACGKRGGLVLIDPLQAACQRYWGTLPTRTIFQLSNLLNSVVAAICAGIAKR